MDHPFPELESLTAVAVANVDEDGTLRWAKAGFRRLIEPASDGHPGANVAHCFLQPTFETLAGTAAGTAASDAGDVYRGLLTIGDFQGRTCSLRGVVTRAGRELRIIAEHDIEELTRLNEVVLMLNRDYAGAQRDLAQANLVLQQLNQTLTLQKAELQATLDRVSRLEGILSICSYCKKVRTSDDAWQQVEHYVTDHSDVVFSHGICPACYEDQMRHLDTVFPRQP
ncbi:MAG TPA: hypothetical protein VGJ96_04435 [Gemmatimonadaceae bacterium]|jgi:hypothetical protein